MLYRSIYLYSFFFLVFGLVCCFTLLCPTKQNIEQYQLSLSPYSDLSSRKERVTYIKTGAVKDIFSQDKISIRRYKVSCPKALVHIEQKKKYSSYIRIFRRYNNPFARARRDKKQLPTIPSGNCFL